MLTAWKSKYAFEVIMSFNSSSSPLINIIVAGVVRDCAKTLERDFNNLSAIIGSKNVFFILIESDSKDRTVEILEKLSKSNKNIIYESLGTLEYNIPSRLERLAYCRNMYLDKIHNDTFANFEYVLVADFDGVNKKFTKKSLHSCWDRTNWSVCTANQAGPYYDIFALRKDKWVDKDCFLNYQELITQGRSHSYAFYKSIVSKMFKSRDSEWIQVESAFGGVAIYRKKELLSSTYSAFDEYGRKQCEHVSLNRKIVKLGGKIFINPKMINSGITSNAIRAVIKFCLLLIYGEKYYRIFKKEIYPS